MPTVFLYFFTSLLGWVTLIIISTQYKSNKFVNSYLVLLLSLISCRFLIAGYNELYPISILKEEVMKFSPLLIIIFPCIYLYFKKLRDSEGKFEVNELKHFCIPIFSSVTNIVIDHSSIYIGFVYHLLFSLIALYYVCLSYIELKKGIWNTHNKISVLEKKFVLLRNWTFLIFIICVLSVVRLLVCLFVDLYSGDQSYGNHYLWITAVFSCILFFKILVTPEILFGYNLLQDKIKENRKAEFVFGEFWIDAKTIKITNIQDLKLKQKIDEHLSSYIQDIEIVAFQQNWFRNSDISLGDFATKLGIPKSHLTYVFKYHSKITFIDFKKRIRIHDSVRLIENNFLKSNTLESLAKEVGFSSYNPFFTSFKEIVGTIPQEFNKHIKEL